MRKQSCIQLEPWPPHFVAWYHMYDMHQVGRGGAGDSMADRSPIIHLAKTWPLAFLHHLMPSSDSKLHHLSIPKLNHERNKMANLKGMPGMSRQKD